MPIAKQQVEAAQEALRRAQQNFAAGTALTALGLVDGVRLSPLPQPGTARE